MTRKLTTAETTAKEELAAFDALAEKWSEEVGWREQLHQLAEMSTKFAGSRISGDGGAELRMLILRQRQLIDRWVRQAYIEGFATAKGYSVTRAGRSALTSGGRDE